MAPAAVNAEPRESPPPGRATSPAVASGTSANSRRHVRRTAGHAARRGHEAARDSARDGGSGGVRASASEHDDGEHAQSATYTVRPGDSLWRIADRHLGAGATATATAQEVTRLWEINEQRIGTGDPDLIFPGQRLRM
jgi:nucleoid-associated protein YgaU